jgi:hypothetical protein
MNPQIDYVLAAAVVVQQGVIIALVWANHRARVETVRTVDRLLLLGKSSSPGEAIAAYERLNRIERARDELMAQAKRERVRGAAPASDGVARKDLPGSTWFGFRRRPRTPPANGG